MKKQIVAWVLVALHATASADARLYLDPSGWAGLGITGRYDTVANFQLASGVSWADRRGDGEVISDLQVGLWFETGTLYGDAYPTTETGYLGIEGAYKLALGCTCLTLGPRVALGIGGDNRVWSAVGARLQYEWIWLGLDATHTGAGVNMRSPGEPAPHSTLELGFGLDLHPTRRQAAIGAGVVAGAFALLLGLGIALSGDH